MVPGLSRDWRQESIQQQTTMCLAHVGSISMQGIQVPDDNMKVADVHFSYISFHMIHGYDFSESGGNQNSLNTLNRATPIQSLLPFHSSYCMIHPTNIETYGIFSPYREKVKLEFYHANITLHVLEINTPSTPWLFTICYIRNPLRHL